MYDKPLALEILSQIAGAIQTIQRRFQSIHTVEDFTTSDEGMMKFDAICMQLQVIGESLKNLDKVTQYSLLAQYPKIEWRNIKGMRDIISHHYFQVDAEVVFTVCSSRLDPLLGAINQMIARLREQAE
jgi:uncharacterized protein with HEPN domain